MEPKPLQRHLDVWLGGRSPGELRRVGRVGDGWLPSFCTPDDLRRGIPRIQEVAADHGREIDPEHFGALIPYVDGPVPDTVRAGIQARRPQVDPDEVVASGLDGLRRTAAAIGETDEEVRCDEFLHQLDPDGERIDREPAG